MASLMDLARPSSEGREWPGWAGARSAGARSPAVSEAHEDRIRKLGNEISRRTLEARGTDTIPVDRAVPADERRTPRPPGLGPTIEASEPYPPAAVFPFAFSGASGNFTTSFRIGGSVFR